MKQKIVLTCEMGGKQYEYRHFSSVEIGETFQLFTTGRQCTENSNAIFIRRNDNPWVSVADTFGLTMEEFEKLCNVEVFEDRNAGSLWKCFRKGQGMIFHPLDMVKV